jgi:hypothetical protein
MKINATKSASIMPSKASSSQGKGNTPTTQKIPTEAAKTNQCGDSPKPLKTNMSVEDMIKLVLAMEAMQKANEITQEVIQKYLGSSD